MKTSTIILAAGNATRMGRAPKQLLPVGDETILNRLYRQAARYDQSPTTVTCRDDIAYVAGKSFRPAKYETICDTLYSTSRLWSDKTVVLLGDVVFTRNAIARVFGAELDIVFFGNLWEIYAISFLRSSHERLKDALLVGRNINSDGVNVGKLRYCYKAIAGLPLIGEEIEDKYLIYIHDLTLDIDCEEDYRDLLRWGNYKDDLP